METLDKILSTIFVVRQNIHGRHFNVTGPHFRTLHLLFEEAYKLLDGWYDKTGELIRRQREYTIHNIPAMYELSVCPSDTGVDNAWEMANLSANQLLCIKELAEAAIDSGAFDNAAENDLAQMASEIGEMWYKVGSFTGVTIPA